MLIVETQDFLEFLLIDILVSVDIEVIEDLLNINLAGLYAKLTHNFGEF